MPAEREIIFETLIAKYPNAEITFNDLAGDNDHWQITIIDEALQALSRIEKHRAIMEILAPLNIHAVTLKFN